MEYQAIKYQYKKTTIKVIKQRSKAYYNKIKNRRSIRDVSKIPIEDEIIKNAILSAGSSPSGANMQPWHFVVIKNKIIKNKIRIAAEKEEFNFYNNKASQEWLNALKPLGTNMHKIIVFG